MTCKRGGLLFLAVLGAACGSTGPAPAPGPPPAEVLQVRGTDLSGGPVHVDVMVAGQEVEDAVVKINGQVIPFQVATGRYSSDLTPAVEVGGTLALEVSRGSATVTGTGRVPGAPALIAPGSGEYFSSGENLVVSWTSSTSPDHFAVIAQWSCGPTCGTGTQFDAPGSARSLTIPAGALPAGAIDLTVFAYNDGELAGDYEPTEFHPGMNIRNESLTAFLTLGEAPSRKVSGTISGASAGIVVGLACTGAALQTAATGEDGAYAFDHVPRTSCTLTPSGDGYSFEPPSVTLPAGPEDQVGVSFVARRLLQVRGRVIAAFGGNVEVQHAGQLVDDALVRINGQTLSFVPATGLYQLLLSSPLSSGDAISLEVTTAESSVTGSGVVPEAPVLIAPTPGEQLAPGEDLLVSWTSTTSPSGFVVAVGWSCGPSCGAGRDFPALGSARELVVPAGLLPSGELRVVAYAVNDGQLTGDYDPSAIDGQFGPGMSIVAISAEAVVSR